MKQIINSPIHGRNTLDLILTDLHDYYLPPKPLPPLGKSTHISVGWEPLPTHPAPAQTQYRKYRPITDSGLREFGQWIVNHSWEEVRTAASVEHKWENYTNTVTDAYHRFFPRENHQTSSKRCALDDSQN